MQGKGKGKEPWGDGTPDVVVFVLCVSFFMIGFSMPDLVDAIVDLFKE